MQYRSENALTLVAAACFSLEYWADQKVPARARVNSEIAAANSRWLIRELLGKWLALSQWAEEWAKSTDETLSSYAARLHACWKDRLVTSEYGLAFDAVKGELASWNRALEDTAVAYIQDLVAEDARAVGRYRLPLAVWHGLHTDRQKWSEFTLQHSTRAQFTHEVDHLVAQKLWQDFLGTQTGLSDEARELINEAMNSLGNCVLLKKTFNIGKSAKTLDDWLSGDLKTLAGFDAGKWKCAFGIDVSMSQPFVENLSAIQDAIVARRARIVDDLVVWIKRRDADDQPQDVVDAKAQ